MFGIRACNARGINPKSLILCALPPLLRRSRATFNKKFPNILVFGSAYERFIEEILAPRFLDRLLGEFDRLDDYAKKGDTTTVQVPESVKIASEKLSDIS